MPYDDRPQRTAEELLDIARRNLSASVDARKAALRRNAEALVAGIATPIHELVESKREEDRWRDAVAGLEMLAHQERN